jgi:hypothetical protein
MNLREVREAAARLHNGWHSQSPKLLGDYETVCDFVLATIDPEPEAGITAEWLREEWGFKEYTVYDSVTRLRIDIGEIAVWMHPHTDGWDFYGDDPPRITGDGTHNMRELVEIKNKNKHPKIHDVKISPEMEIFLSRTNRNLDDILPAGLTIDLSEKIGVSYGGNSSEDTEITHSEIKRILEEAAVAINDPLIGFDFIIEHIDRSPDEQKWGIIECNGVPFINLHHDPIEGPSNNVAKHVWDFVEKNAAYY